MAVQITIQDNAKWSYFIFKTHVLFSKRWRHTTYITYRHTLPW